MIGYIHIFVIAVTLISVSDGQPNLTSWNLDLDDNKITLILTTLNSSNNGMPVDCTAISIGPDPRNIRMAIQLLPSVVGLQINSTLVTCDLGMEFRNVLEDTLSLDTAFLYYNSTGAGDEILLQDSSGEVYENIMGIQAAEIVQDSNQPIITSFELLDLDNGELVLSFDQPINITSLNFANLSLRSSPFSDAITVIVPLSGGNCTDGCEIGRLVTLSLSPSDLDRLKLENGVCTHISNCYLYYTDTFVEDFGGNSIAKYSYCKNHLLQNLTLDTTRPSLTGCSLDLSLDQLSLEFDEPIDASSFIPSGVNISTAARNIFLTSASVIRSANNFVIVISLGLDADRIKTSLSVYNNTTLSLFASLIPLAFKDITGNSIYPTSMVCTFINDTNSPNVSSFILDLNSNILQIVFDEPVSMEHINSSGFKLTNAMGGTVISLGDSKLLEYDDLELINACNGLFDSSKLRTVYIALKNTSLATIKANNSFGNTTYLKFLLIDDDSIFDLTGNGFISAGPIAAADVIADNSPATVDNFSLDMNIGRFVLTFSDVVDVSTLRYNEIFIQRSINTLSTLHSPSGTYDRNMDSIIIPINLYKSNLNQLKHKLLGGLATDINTTYLTIRAYAINDIRGVDVIATTNGNGIIASNYIRDSTPPVLTNFNLDMDNGRIYFTFDEPINIYSFNFTLFSLQADSVSVTNTFTTFTINVAYLRSSPSLYSNIVYEYQLSNSLLRILYANATVAANRGTTNLVIMQGGVFDASGNPINTTGPVNVNGYTSRRSATVRFSSSSYRVTESIGVIQIRLYFSYSPLVTTIVQVFTTNATASDSEDYRSGPYTATFSSGRTSASFYITITDDNVVESNEYFILWINPLTLPLRNYVGSPSQATVTIRNDDYASVSFTYSTFNVNEGNGPVQLMLTLTNPSSNVVNIQVLDTDGSATRNIDYSSGAYNVIFFAGMTSASLNVSLINDNVLENNENFFLSINQGSLPTYISAGIINQVIVNIVDDDFITMEFNQSTYRVDEDDGSIQIFLVLSNPSSFVVTADVFSTSDSAIGAGVDYNSGPYTVTLAAGTTTVSFSILITDDSILEGNETFYLTVDPSSLRDDTNVDVGNLFQTTVIIVEDDFTIINFDQSTYIVDEDNGPVQPVLVLSNPSTILLNVQVNSTDGSAIGGGVDYFSGPYLVAFPAGMTTAMVTVQINDNTEYKHNSFDFTLSIISDILSSNIIIGETGQTTVIIIDDESAAFTVNFSQATYSVDEDSGLVQPELVLSDPLVTSTTVHVFTTDGSATGQDYESGPYSITFPVGVTRMRFDVSVISDDIFEHNETFQLSINLSSLPHNVSTVYPNQATVIIINDDFVVIYTVSFNQTVYSASEDSIVAQVTLVLDNPPSTDINIEVITTDGSAIGGGVDYVSESYNVTFHAGETDVTLNISIIDDDILENDENFIVTVTLIPINVVIASNTGYSTVTIMDNDAATLSFNQSTYNAIENSGLVEIVVTLSSLSSNDITVWIDNRHGSATGEDYDSMSSYTVVFLAGMTTASFSISIIDDSVFEGNESFILNINPDLLPDDVTIGDYSETTVTIIDDDEVTVSFDQLTYRVKQHDRLVQPVLNLNIPSSIDITIKVLSIDVTATGEDYGSGPYSVTFAAGITSTVLYISITDDDILEGPEYFNIMIDSSSLISGISVGNLGQATVEILDADGDTALSFISFSSKRQQLRYYLDGVSDAIYISNGFPFGLQTHATAYVGTNGVISFSRPFYYWYTYPFPGRFYLRRFYVVAPYWTDNDIRRDGEVYYEALIKGQNKNDDSVLNRVNHYIALNADPDFIGTFMILAEWQNVHPYPYSSNYYYYFQWYYPSIRTFTKQENTYQALVITDGKESYAIFTYMCGLIQWSGLWRYPTIGYNAGGVLFANHPLTAHKEANQIDCPNNSSRYVNIIYKISADPDTIKILQSQCQSWYFSDIESYGKSEDILNFSKSQIACPCTFFQAWWDRRYWTFTIKDDSFCFIEIFNNTYGGAQECCYSRFPQMFGSLVLQGRSSGGLLRYHPWWSWTINYPKYIEYDRNPQDICCLSAVGYCNLHHERRPVHNCEGYIPQLRTRGRGDPHITTIDGRTYTFNGLGEYVMLRENASNFEFQGRTELAPNSNATIFSAFAMRDGDNNVEVGTNVITGLFTINLDGIDMSDNLTSVGDNVTTSSSFIERSSNNSVTVSFPSGVGITINYTAGLLVYTLEVPPSFERTTSGLLGNYNNDDSDEFVFRDGTMISNSSSDREIHQFGQSWQITSAESIFTYKAGEGVNTFSNPNHVPPFLDEILSSLMGNSTLTDVCGENVECLFDFAQTGDAEVGMVAIAIANETAIETQEAFSFPPNITAPETFMATVGEESVYTFTVSSDSQNISVIILHEGEETLPSGVLLNNPIGDSYTITWTPADNTASLNLTIVAADLNMKNISSIFNPVVQLCACENGGNCTTDGLLINDFSFIVLNCECPEGYDGEFCQNDADGCEIISCLEGQQCFDYPAPQVGAGCACPDGYASDSDSKCIDINECVNRSTIDCTQQCINTPGSYECDCYDGYRAITANATQCEDINECDGYNDCHQMCTNTNGSYYCSCNTGFMLATDATSCEAVAPCIMNNCSQSCANINGKETCFCMAGYQLGLDNVTCLDIDECVQTPCEQNCINTIGSFTCSCNSGYQLDENGRSCNDINECLSGPCPSNLMCNNVDGNYSCDCPDGTLSNGTRCILVRDVTPSRLTTTPPPTTSQMLSTTSVTSSPSVSLAPKGEKLADDLSIGAIVGIIVGGFVILLIIVLIICIVAKKMNSKPRKSNRLLDSSQNNWPLEMLSSGSDPLNY